ncbi:tRNA(Ile)-lysidine synthase [compost metagenome]
MSLETRLLESLAPWRGALAWCVGLSGGLDSTVLLHLLACLARRETLPPLSAIHIHHGLQAVADDWPEHCRQFCESLGIPLHIERVEVAGGPSVERAAREARYAAMARHLASGECLITGQHRDDQAETVLFRLFRGAGVRGLAGIPPMRALGHGLLLRPMLAFSRAELEGYARAQGLSWVEDPSNRDTEFDRNYLRQIVLPGVAARWPGAVANLARSAAHLAEAEGLLAELAELDLVAADRSSDHGGWGLPWLQLEALRQLSEPRQRNALRRWLTPWTSMPDSAHWAGWVALRDAAGDAEPVWRLSGGELRRAQGRLWWLSGAWLQAPGAPPDWTDLYEPLRLPGNGRLRFIGIPPPGVLSVRYRRGGEVLDLPGRGRRDLKRLLNEAGVPAFLRGRLPLLFRSDELIGVASLPGLRAMEGEPWSLLWEPPTNDSGLS